MRNYSFILEGDLFKITKNTLGKQNVNLNIFKNWQTYNSSQPRKPNHNIWSRLDIFIYVIY